MLEHANAAVCLLYPAAQTTARYACRVQTGLSCVSSMYSTTVKSQCRLHWLQLCDGASSAEKERWCLKPPQEFHYLNQSTCYNLPRVSNADEYRVGLSQLL